jgi:hypothetical protein
MKVLVCLALLFAFSMAIMDINPVCKYTATDGSQYDLTPLKRTTTPFFHMDQNGNKWYFNVCGELKGLQVTPQCPPESYVCEIPKGTSFGVNAGKVGLWSDYAPTASKGVEIVYGDGDKCETSVPRKTTFEFVCDESENLLSVDKVVTDTDKCYSVITVKSQFACKINEEATAEVHLSAFFTFFFLSCLTCAICMCLCACCARRRRCRQQKHKKEQEEMVQFSNVTWQQVPQEMPTQYLHAPQYFIYPSVQTPIQQAPATLERESLLSADEQLAKELQAKFDAEH